MFCRKIQTVLHVQCNVITLVCIKPPLNCCYRQESGLRLEDKVVIVTGAGLGIGASAAMEFARQKSKVVVTDINKENACKVSKHCQEKLCADTMGFACDVTKDDEVQALVKATIEKYCQIDVLVNNAGILTFGSLVKQDLMKNYDRTLACNLRGSIYLAMLATPYLVKTKGNIINISSILGKYYAGNSKYMPYCISKAGLDHFMFGAALELSKYGVRVNNVCPGPVKTEIFKTAGVKGSFKEIGQSFKIGDALEPQEIADLIVYLASYKARSITGVRYYIDNGTLIMG